MSGKQPIPVAPLMDSGMATLAGDGSALRELMCAKCHQVWDNPMMLQCGHRICKSCLAEITRGWDTSISCPAGESCKDSDISKVKRDNWAAKAIRRIRDERLSQGTAGANPEDNAMDGKTSPRLGTKHATNKENSDPKRPPRDNPVTGTNSLEKNQQPDALWRYTIGLKEMEAKMTLLKEKFARQEQIHLETEKKLNNSKERLALLEREVENIPTKTVVERHSREIRELNLRLASAENSFNKLEHRPACTRVIHAPVEDGHLIWMIPNYTFWKNSTDVASLTSEPFYTSKYGYKLCARVYLNGDGEGCRGKYISFFITLMKGHYDELLSWPFTLKVVLSARAQNVNGDRRHDWVRQVTFNPNTPSCQRPTGDTNPAFGLSKFARMPAIEDPLYIADDTLFLEVMCS